MKKYITIALLGFSWVIFAQETLEDLPVITGEKITFLDSIKATFINHKTSNCIDQRWLSELATNDMFEEMQSEISEGYIDDSGAVTNQLPTDILKARLAKLDAKTPINIEYAPELERLINKFLSNGKTSYERLMAVSEYYFPMFEEHLAKYDIPLEIKYLAIVESGLNAKARSYVGASGLWQFMYPTGKQFNLEINSYVDERFDPIKSTEAACQYLSSLYKIFGDWNLALASYNAGPGNVSKAIRRSGGSQNFWNIKQYLPRETANYVPAFMATMYLYEYQKEHNFAPQKAPTTYFETDTIAVKKEISFKQISDLLDISEEQIEFFNPTFKLKVIPYTQDKAHFLRLPKSDLGVFLSNEDKVYAYVDYVNSGKETIRETVVAEVSEEAPKGKLIYHKIRNGESIGGIADKYNVKVSDIRKWNGMRSNTIYAGKKLKIYSSVKSSSKNNSNSSGTSYYTVKSGDSFYTIAKKYPGVSADDIKKWNDISGNTIRPGMKLKIKK